jgi:arylsulfatase A-like enzyme
MLVGGAAVGLLVGYSVALKALEARHALETAANRQWFALGELVSKAVLPWASLGLGIGLAVACALAVLGHYSFAPKRYQQRLWRLLILVLLAISLPALGLSLTPVFRPRSSGSNVLVILMDTTRPDRMSLYGYDRPTTTNLESLARQSTVYTRAYSTSSWTPPSHASLFTGLSPCLHGVTNEAPSYPPKLATRFLTLAEVFWEAGYRTAAFVGNPMLHAGTGFSQGFEEFHETWRLDHEDGHPAERLLRDLLDRPSDRPYFVFINLMEPHSPYDSSGEFFGLYDRHPELSSLVDSDWLQHLTERAYSPAELEHLGDLYDSEIQYVDSLVGNMVQLLSGQDILDETLIVVTSDHGEHFGEHGLVEHVFNLHETNVRVPLLIRYPPRYPPGVRDPSLVQLQDLFETILSTAGLGGRHDSEGADLLGGVPETRPVFLEYYAPLTFLETWGEGWGDLPQLDPFKRRLRAVRYQSFKLILGSDGGTELYDVVRDPLELEDLSGQAEYAAELTRLQKALLRDRFTDCQEDPAIESSPIELDEKTIRELRSLGYIP